MLKLEWNLKFFVKSIIYIVQGNYLQVMMKFVIQSVNSQTFQQTILGSMSTFFNSHFCNHYTFYLIIETFSGFQSVNQ